MLVSLRFRVVLSALFAFVASFTPARDALAVKVSVKATTTIEARVTADGDAQIIRGTLKDDVGAPVPSAHVEVDVLSPNGDKPVDLPPPRPCSTGDGRLPHAAPDAYVLDTDEQGVFCVRTENFASRGTLRIRFSGERHYAPSKLDLAFDADRPAPSLAWSPQPDVIDLDLPAAKISVVATSRIGGGRPLEAMRLVLLDGDKPIAKARTDERGRATFDVATASFAAPGSRDLVVRDEDATPGIEPLHARVLLSAKVALVASPPADPIVPHDGHAFEVAAETSRGPAASGAIEARAGGEIVGAGTVQRGRAHVVTTFEVPSAGDLDVAFTYFPATPELRPGEPLTIRVPVKPPSLGRRAPLFAVATLLVAWLARGWRRAPRSSAKPKRDERAAPLPPFVAVAERGATGWRGTVLDAHEKVPIARAVVAVVERGFLGEKKVVEATTDATGAFVIESAWQAERFLVAEAPLHARIERPLPPWGRVTIALTSRRRALLDRLVTVVRRENPAISPEPTPAQIARIAEDGARGGLAKWARAVEAAAYGAPPVDARVEAEVSALESDVPRDDNRR